MFLPLRRLNFHERYLQGRLDHSKPLNDKCRGTTTLLTDGLASVNLINQLQLTPLQIPAAPYWPDLSAWTNETTMREPELPRA